MKKKMIWKLLLLTTVCVLSACQGKKREEVRLTGIEQMKNRDYEGAMASFEQALELSGGRVSAFELDILKYRAEAEYQLKDYEAAAHTYDILLVADAERAEYYLYRCMAYTMSHSLSEAVSDYETAAKMILKEEKPEAKERLMAVLERLGSFLREQPAYREKEMSLYREAMDAGYASGSLYNHMGMLCMEAENYDEAIALFEQGLGKEEDGARSDLVFNRAVAYEKKLDFSKALSLFEQYVSEFGSDEAAEKEITFLRTR